MNTSVERDERVMAILANALNQPLPERELYIQMACNNDPDLYREVAEAVEWEARMGNFLMEPWVEFTQLARPFQAGQIIEERFEIVREIGEGGMGIVYEALDHKLHIKPRIAIKAAKPGFQRLLSPELEGALSVRHRNICLVNQIHTAPTEYGQIDFLTMEFLDGPTLSAYLSQKGRLEHGEALEIACQICKGLAEAHHSGIIHRDLKSGNVMLCQDEDGRRAVITDFGLAGGLGLPSGEMGGTPGYMAPELWAGEKASKASDIYALGVILYEMVAGRKPYKKEPGEESATGRVAPTTWANLPQQHDAEAGNGHHPHSTWMGKKLIGEAGTVLPPPPPSTWVKGLDTRWDRVIMGCLAASPAERTQDVTEVLAGLQKEPVNPMPFIVTAVLLVILSAVFSLVRPLREWAIERIWPPNVRLAVLPLDKQTDPAMAAIAGGALQEVADQIQHLPSGRRSVAVIPPSRAEYMHVVSPQQARDVLHATHALRVSLQQEDRKLLARASVIDLNSLLPVKELSVQYPQSDAGAMSTALTHFVAMAFRLREPPESSLAPAAAEPYLKGLYFLNRDMHSFDEAMGQFQEAARLDPNSPLPLADMALALMQKFNVTGQNKYLDQAREFVLTAQSRNPDSGRVLLASGRVYEATSQYNKALQAYHRIQELEPRNLDALLRMGVVYQQMEEPEEALAAFRKAQALDSEYYKPYKLLGDFYLQRGRYVESAEQYRKMIERAPGMFDAYTSLASPLVELGRYTEAEEALQKSLKIRETAYALNHMGAIRCRQGRFEEAVAYQKRALAYDPENYNWLLNLGDNVRWAGHQADARPYYSKGRDQARAEMTLNPQSARARAYFAYFSARLRDTVRAKDEIKQARNLAPGDREVRLFVVLTYELLGERDLALDAIRGIDAPQQRQLCGHPDLAGFCQDPRFQQQMVDKGGQ